MSGCVKVKLVFQGREESVEVDTSEGMLVLKLQVMSLFDVETESQIIITRGKKLADDENLAALNLEEGQKLLIMTLSPNKTAPPPAPKKLTPVVIEDPSTIKITCSRARLGETPIRQPAFTKNFEFVCMGCAHKHNNVQGNTPLDFASKQPPRFVCATKKPDDAVTLGNEDQMRRAMISVLENEHASLGNRLRDTHRAILSQQQGGQEDQFKGRVMSAFNQVMQYEDQSLQAQARQVIPVARLQAEATAAGGEFTQDNLIRALLHWYKHEFFKWVNEPACTACGTGTQRMGADRPNPEERIWLAGVVEVFSCPQCNTVVRFPRYNHAGKLLQTRQGRCGEWAQCFTLCCRALGIPARFVNDWTDHVWTEVYSQEHKAFVHTDCCEDKFNAPLLYEAGWGKSLNYVVATSVEEVVDVTWRYTNKPQEVLTRRNLVREDWLSHTLSSLDALALERAMLPGEKRAEVLARRQQEDKWLHSRSPWQNSTSAPGQAGSLSAAELEGRVSGALAWRQARGEAGAQPQPQSQSQTLTPEDLARMIGAVSIPKPNNNNNNNNQK